MLKSILSGETCGRCRNCCVFFSESRWEMPSVSEENADKICKLLGNEQAVEKRNDVYNLKSMLRENRQGNDSEEYKCPALDENKGCVLPESLKPVECSMWPLRVMQDDDRLYITLAGGCHAVDEKFTEDVKKLLDDGLYKKIISILKRDKSIVKEFESSYIKLAEITEV